MFWLFFLEFLQFGSAKSKNRKKKIAAQVVHQQLTNVKEAAEEEFNKHLAKQRQGRLYLKVDRPFCRDSDTSTGGTNSTYTGRPTDIDYKLREKSSGEVIFDENNNYLGVAYDSNYISQTIDTKSLLEAAAGRRIDLDEELELPVDV